MGNKPDKIIKNNNQIDEKNKLDELISNYLTSGEKHPKLKKILNDDKSNNNKFSFEKSHVTEFLKSQNFFDFSLTLANLIKLKALVKDLNTNFEKCFILNCNAIQLCPVEDKKYNLFFDNKSAMLQMNSYDNKFKEEITEKFIVNQIKRYDTLKKEELQFENEISEEIKILNESKIINHRLFIKIMIILRRMQRKKMIKML